MSNYMQCFIEPIAIVSETTPVASEAEISAVALLKLLMRAEATSTAISAADSATSAAPTAQCAQSLPINDQCDVVLELSPYLKEQLNTIADAVFNRFNGDFYRAYKGLAASEMAEIVLSQEDLRPLAYRALMYEGPAAERPFAPRFASSLLLLQKFWDCQFLQEYKDVAGRLSAYSLSRALR